MTDARNYGRPTLKGKKVGHSIVIENKMSRVPSEVVYIRRRHSLRRREKLCPWS